MTPRALIFDVPRTLANTELDGHRRQLTARTTETRQ